MKFNNINFNTEKKRQVQHVELAFTINNDNSIYLVVIFSANNKALYAFKILPETDNVSKLTFTGSLPLLPGTITSLENSIPEFIMICFT